MHACGRGVCIAVAAMKGVVSAVAVAAVIATAAPAIAQDLPQMDPDRPVRCVKDLQGRLWRVQCDETRRACLYAPNDELDTDGDRARPLERVRFCPVDERPFDRAGLEAAGYSMIAGLPDAPHGWMRDDRGRVFQVNFDLRRRLYLGGSWAPSADLDGATASARSVVDFGLFVYERFGDDDSPNRHRVRIAEGTVHLQPFAAELVIARYELSRRYIEPLLRLTTFFGTPHRYDLGLNIGLWSEAGRVEVHHTDVADSNLWRFATAQATLDLWQSEQLDSFARIRSGVGVEALYTDAMPDRTAVTASSAFELDWVIDRAGFHNVRAELGYERPYYIEPDRPAVAGERTQRMRARLQYEAIVLAINDQPLSVVVGAGGEKRNDVPGVPNEWAFLADAGLRFSLWAPPRPR